MTAQTEVPTLVEVIDNKDVKYVPTESVGRQIYEFCASNWMAVLAELVSTFLLLLFGCMACIPIDGFDPNPPMYSPLAFGLVVLTNVQIFGHLSGAHMNPAVTLLAVYKRITSIPLGVIYVIAQCIGSILGYGMLMALSPMSLTEENICLTLPHKNINAWQAFAIEILLTTLLALLCCACWDPVNESKQDSIPVKFGLAVAALSLTGGPLTGAGMNPARTLGPALWANNWRSHWVYWVGPLCGATLAAPLYGIMSMKREKKD